MEEHFTPVDGIEPVPSSRGHQRGGLLATVDHVDHHRTGGQLATIKRQTAVFVSAEWRRVDHQVERGRVEDLQRGREAVLRRVGRT